MLFTFLQFSLETVAGLQILQTAQHRVCLTVGVVALTVLEVTAAPWRSLQHPGGHYSTLVVTAAPWWASSFSHAPQQTFRAVRCPLELVMLLCVDLASLSSPPVTAGSVCLQWGKLRSSESSTGIKSDSGKSIV